MATCAETHERFLRAVELHEVRLTHFMQLLRAKNAQRAAEEALAKEQAAAREELSRLNEKWESECEARSVVRQAYPLLEQLVATYERQFLGSSLPLPPSDSDSGSAAAAAAISRTSTKYEITLIMKLVRQLQRQQGLYEENARLAAQVSRWALEVTENEAVLDAFFPDAKRARTETRGRPNKITALLTFAQDQGPVQYERFARIIRDVILRLPIRKKRDEWDYDYALDKRHQKGETQYIEKMQRSLITFVAIMLNLGHVDARQLIANPYEAEVVLDLSKLSPAFLTKVCAFLTKRLLSWKKKDDSRSTMLRLLEDARAYSVGFNPVWEAFMGRGTRAAESALKSMNESPLITVRGILLHDIMHLFGKKNRGWMQRILVRMEDIIPGFRRHTEIDLNTVPDAQLFALRNLVNELLAEDIKLDIEEEEAAAATARESRPAISPVTVSSAAAAPADWDAANLFDMPPNGGGGGGGEERSTEEPSALADAWQSDDDEDGMEGW